VVVGWHLADGEAGPLKASGQVVRDPPFPGGSGDQPGVHAVNRDQLAEQGESARGGISHPATVRQGVLCGWRRRTPW
jgi:hypothetical protein